MHDFGKTIQTKLKFRLKAVLLNIKIRIFYYQLSLLYNTVLRLVW